MHTWSVISNIAMLEVVSTVGRGDRTAPRRSRRVHDVATAVLSAYMRAPGKSWLMNCKLVIIRDVSFISNFFKVPERTGTKSESTQEYVHLLLYSCSRN